MIEPADLEALVEQAVRKPPCFALALEGDARTYMTALEARKAADVDLNYTVISDTLTSTFGLPISQQAVNKHLSKGCACWKT